MGLPFDATTQDYIKTILKLEKENRVARVTDIAEQRGVTKSSVSLVMRHLHEKELIDRKQYGHITLTKSGRRLGNSLLQRHEILTLFLTNILRVPHEIAEQDACKLEHALSKESWQNLKHFVEVAEQFPNGLTDQLNSIKECVHFGSGDLECAACPVTNTDENNDTRSSKIESNRHN